MKLIFLLLLFLFCFFLQIKKNGRRKIGSKIGSQYKGTRAGGGLAVVTAGPRSCHGGQSRAPNAAVL